MQPHAPEIKKRINETIEPLKNIEFSTVIEELSGCKVLPFNPEEKRHQKILDKLCEMARLVVKSVNVNGIARVRANEVGNDIEKFVERALDQVKYKSEKPVTKKGHRKAAGYPDLAFIDDQGVFHYIECKTYNVDKLKSPMRSFYISPSKKFKVTKDAIHFCVSFEIFVSGRSGNKNVYKCKGWKILSLKNLSVDLKSEFNSDNKRLYHPKLLIAQE